MNHEERIKSLEKQVTELKETLSAWGLTRDWLTISQAKVILNQSSWVIRDRIKRDPNLKLGVHYRKNGNRYLINTSAWKDLDGYEDN